MRTFDDTFGRTWRIELDASTLARVRALLGVDLADAKRASAALGNDPELLVNVLYVVCKPQADGWNVDDVAFGRHVLGGAAWVVKRAMAALLGEMIGLAPEHEQPWMRKSYRKHMLAR